MVFLTEMYHFTGSLTFRSTFAFGYILTRSFQNNDIGKSTEAEILSVLTNQRTVRDDVTVSPDHDSQSAFSTDICVYQQPVTLNMAAA